MNITNDNTGGLQRLSHYCLIGRKGKTKSPCEGNSTTNRGATKSKVQIFSFFSLKSVLHVKVSIYTGAANTQQQGQWRMWRGRRGGERTPRQKFLKTARGFFFFALQPWYNIYNQVREAKTRCSFLWDLPCDTTD